MLGIKRQSEAALVGRHARTLGTGQRLVDACHLFHSIVAPSDPAPNRIYMHARNKSSFSYIRSIGTYVWYACLYCTYGCTRVSYTHMMRTWFQRWWLSAAAAAAASAGPPPPESSSMLRPDRLVAEVLVKDDDVMVALEAERSSSAPPPEDVVRPPPCCCCCCWWRDDEAAIGGHLAAVGGGGGHAPP